jgi:superfamily II DNA/RNA helicase
LGLYYIHTIFLSAFKKNNYKADCIHGDIVQNKREKILQNFRDEKINILIATDVAARGIDINNLTHVVNHSLPQSIETYTHRIGRTGRAGNKGTAVTLLTDAEMRRLSTLERMTGFKLRKDELPTDKDHQIKTQDKLLSEYDDIILTRKHSNELDISKELLKKYKPEDLVAALLFKIKPKFEKSNTEPKEERRNNNRGQRNSGSRGGGERSSRDKRYSRDRNSSGDRDNRFSSRDRGDRNNRSSSRDRNSSGDRDNRSSSRDRGDRNNRSSSRNSSSKSRSYENF